MKISCGYFNRNLCALAVCKTAIPARRKRHQASEQKEYTNTEVWHETDKNRMAAAEPVPPGE